MSKHTYYTQLTPQQMEQLALFEKSIRDIEINLMELKAGKLSMQNLIQYTLLDVKIITPQLRKMRTEIYKNKNTVTLKKLQP